jgi:hypothetical protein
MDNKPSDFIHIHDQLLANVDEIVLIKAEKGKNHSSSPQFDEYVISIVFRGSFIKTEKFTVGSKKFLDQTFLQYIQMSKKFVLVSEFLIVNKNEISKMNASHSIIEIVFTNPDIPNQTVPCVFDRRSEIYAKFQN